MRKKTTLYFSGAGFKIENFALERIEDFRNCGVLLSYWDLRKQGRARARLDTLVSKENMDEDKT